MDPHSVLVRMEIPIDADPLPTGRMAFSHWLPIGDDGHIVVDKGDITLTFRFDRSCFPSVPPGEEVSQLVDVGAHRVIVEATIKNVSEQLVGLMREASVSQSVKEGPLQKEYEALGERVYVLTLTSLNRLISYVRCYKGQYWLREHPIDTGTMASTFNGFKTKVKLPDGKSYRWRPSSMHRVMWSAGDNARYITQDDWPRAREFVNSESRPSFILELLARAESLAEENHPRVALTEAVTALEVAVHRFAERPKAQKLFDATLAERLELDRLSKAVEEAGLRKTFWFLLPLLFSEEQVPREILRKCVTAIDDRNNVTHRGQQDVAPKKLKSHLSAIRTMCSILQEYEGK